MTRHISPLAVFLALLGIFVLCYASALRSSYGFTDDYAILMGAVRGTPDVNVAVAGGRPTYAFFLRVFFAPLRGIGDLRYVRFFGVLCITVLAFSLYRSLVHNGWETLPSFFLAVIIGTLPSFQVYAAWAAVSFYPCAMLVAAGGLLFVEQACAEGRGGKQRRWAAGAVSLVTLALTIHQTSAMFFWVFAAVFLLRPEMIGEEVLRRVWWYGGVMTASLILGFVIFRIGVLSYGAELIGMQRATLVTDVVGKMYWFLKEPLKNSLNAINVLPTWTVAVGVALWTAGGVSLLLRGTLREKIIKSMCLLALLPLSYLPNLLVAENWASYRTLGAFTSLVMLYVCSAMSGYERFLRRFVAVRLCTVALGMIAVTSTVLAARQVANYFVAPQRQELEFMRTRLARADWSSVNSVYVVGLDDLRKSRGSRLPVRYDEFGFSSLVPAWSLRAMPYLLLRGLAPERREMSITLASAAEPNVPPPHALVIDLRTLPPLTDGVRYDCDPAKQGS